MEFVFEINGCFDKPLLLSHYLKSLKAEENKTYKQLLPLPQTDIFNSSSIQQTHWYSLFLRKVVSACVGVLPVISLFAFEFHGILHIIYIHIHTSESQQCNICSLLLEDFLDIMGIYCQHLKSFFAFSFVFVRVSRSISNYTDINVVVDYVIAVHSSSDGLYPISAVLTVFHFDSALLNSLSLGIYLA